MGLHFQGYFNVGYRLVFLWFAWLCKALLFPPVTVLALRCYITELSQAVHAMHALLPEV